MKNLHLDIDNTINFNFAYPPGNTPYKDTDLEIWVICRNKLLQGQNNFPHFEINELTFNQHYHFPHFLKTGKVVVWVSLYIHVFAVSGVSNRNG